MFLKMFFADGSTYLAMSDPSVGPDVVLRARMKRASQYWNRTLRAVWDVCEA